jgi:NADPH:quinone reductase-like Zn-dependent oxidoreductase
MPTNKALYLPYKKAPHFEVKLAPYPSALADRIVVKNYAIAINPADWILQEKGDFIFTWLKYPCVFGSDVAGEVVEVGKQVTGFQIGDRVLGYAIGLDEKVNDAAEGAFQEYTVLRPHLTSHIPDSLSYEKACVLPLGVATAAAALFQKDQLGLELPTLNSTSKNKTIIVWGGSTSVGSNAIQLGVAAGYEVFTTASPSNFQYIMKLGASKVFDYRSKTVVADMIAGMKGRTAAGALTCGNGGAEACIAILNKSKGSKFISMANFPAPENEPESFVLPRTIYFFATWMISFKFKGLFKGIKSNFLYATTVAYNEVGKAIYGDFLPKALEKGTYMAAPEPYVFGKGVESIEGAVYLQKRGMSARKVVVTL